MKEEIGEKQSRRSTGMLMTARVMDSWPGYENSRLEAQSIWKVRDSAVYILLGVQLIPKGSSTVQYSTRLGYRSQENCSIKQSSSIPIIPLILKARDCKHPPL